MRAALRITTLAALVASGESHAVLSAPRPRPGTGGVSGLGIKLQPFADADNYANDAFRPPDPSNRACGGSGPPQNDVGVTVPTESFQPGQTINIEWALTIPHPLDVDTTGVRIALHYGPGDSFENNVLLGGLTDASGFPAGPVDAVAGQNVRTLATLPTGKTCNYCTMQFIWAARSDGGFYISCADISITTTGLLPDFGELPPETGPLPVNPGSIINPGSSNSDDSDSSSLTWIGILVGVIIGGAAIVGITVYLFLNRERYFGGESLWVKPKGVPPPPPPVGDAEALPSGWSAVTDSSSHQTYYVNQLSGESTWEKPTSGSDTQVAPRLAAELPEGWSAATDPASGQTYYINQKSGQTSWELQSSRI